MSVNHLLDLSGELAQYFRTFSKVYEGVCDGFTVCDCRKEPVAVIAAGDRYQTIIDISPVCQSDIVCRFHQDTFG